MSLILPPHQSAAPNELDPDFVSALADFDERLRRGEHSRRNRPDAVDTVTSDDRRRAENCLELLEAAWPRLGSTTDDNPADDWISGPRRIARFEIVRLIGGGGFSLVYLARDPELNRLIALKVPRPHMLLDGDLGRRFLREAQAIAALDHPHIVPVYETGRIGPAVYLAMAYCEGPNLGAWLAQRNASVPPQLAAEILATLAGAIQFSHDQGVLHRDLKPANVLLFPSTSRELETLGAEFPFVPRIADFGLAKLLEGALEDTRSSVVLGTPLYMAPEQATGKASSISPATDIYGLGGILYELLLGRPPFVGETVLEVLDRLREEAASPIRKLRPDIPRDLETICLKCLSKDPADRYAGGAELQQDLRRYLDGHPIQARPLGALSKMMRITRKPARVRDAALYSMMIYGSLNIWITVAAVAAIFQLGPTSGGTDIVAGYLIGVVSGFLFCLVPSYFAWMIWKRRPWAALGGTISGIASLAYTIPYVLGYVPIDYGGQYKDPNSRILVFTMLSVLFFGQTVLNWFAYRILRAEQCEIKQARSQAHNDDLKPRILDRVSTTSLGN